MFNNVEGKSSKDLKCACCGRLAKNIPTVVYNANAEGMSVEDFVIEDGTYSHILNTFVCDECYTSAGVPAISANNINSEFGLQQAKLEVINRCRSNFKLPPLSN